MEAVGRGDGIGAWLKLAFVKKINYLLYVYCFIGDGLAAWC